jgi:hypothetical protein
MSKEATHKVVITVTSHLKEPDVHMEVSYGPIGDVPEEEDYMPAAYEFVERALVNAIEQAQGPIEFQEGIVSRPRSLN